MLKTTLFLIYTCGVFSLGFAIFHLYFWKLFDWKNDLKKLTKANQAIMQILNLRLIYIFICVGATCFIFPVELLSTKLGNCFLLGNSLFWIGRTIENLLFLKVRHRMVHILTAIFIFGAVLFAAPVFVKLVFFKPCPVTA